MTQTLWSLSHMQYYASIPLTLEVIKADIDVHLLNVCILIQSAVLYTFMIWLFHLILKLNKL